MVGQRRIDERFLPLECFRGTATRETAVIGISLNHFREEFGDRTQSKPVPPVPAIQGFPQHKLTGVRVVAEIQPVVDFTPILGALRYGCSCFSRVDTADYEVHCVSGRAFLEYLASPGPRTCSAG